MPQSGEVLFEVPIASGGQVICTTPAPKVYVLEFTSPPDNRLKTDFCEALHLALDIVELRYPHGVLITTSGIPKFYSNGLDLKQAFSTAGFFPNTLYALWRRLLIYPMPTIAVINGHAFAGALMLAMHHDYRIMNAQKGFVCLNEIDFGAPLKPPMTSIFRQKVSPTTYRSLVLEGKRFNGPQALQERIVDGLGGVEEALKLIEQGKLTTKSDAKVYGLMKREMWKETLYYLDNQWEEATIDSKWSVEKAREDELRNQRIEAFKINSKSKL